MEKWKGLHLILEADLESQEEVRQLPQSIPPKMHVWSASISLQWGGRCAVSFKQHVALYPIIGLDIIPDVCEVSVTAAWEMLEVQQLQLSALYAFKGVCVGKRTYILNIKPSSF